MVVSQKADIIAGLQSDILRMQGFKPATSSPLDLGLGIIAQSFPNRAFPLGAIHEFLIEKVEDSASSIGFTAGLLGNLMSTQGAALWISSSGTVFPPALKNFGVNAERIVFLHLHKTNDVLWAMHEALKCCAITSVVAEVREISFNESRRLQLAVEQSRVTGFLLRSNYKTLGTTACVSRWKITQIPSDELDNLPGIGFPKWRVELLRIRNGKPGSWDVTWRNGRFHNIQKYGMDHQSIREQLYVEKRKVG
jgi:protein ImuA